MTASKYKVGDIVIVKKLFEENRYGGRCVFKDMVAQSGNALRVIAVHCDSYFLGESYTNHCWTDEMLDPMFSYGDMIEVKHIYNGWIPRVFISYLPGQEKPYLIVRDTYQREFQNGNLLDDNFATFKEARRIQPKIKKETIKIGDVEFDKKEVEERLKGLKPLEAI